MWRVPDGVWVNAAGRVRGIEGNMREPALMISGNLGIALKIFEDAVRGGVKRVVNFGSTCAYSPRSGVPFRVEDYLEGEPAGTNGAYAWAKRMVYVMSRAYAKQYGMDNLYLVMPNLYGPGNFKHTDGHVIPEMVRKVDRAIVEGGGEVVFLGSGMAEREFLYVEDAADLVVKAVEEVHSGDPVHLTSGGGTITIRELAGLLKRLMGYEGELAWDVTKPDGQMRRLLSPGITHPDPVSFKEGLRKTIESYRREKVGGGLTK